MKTILKYVILAITIPLWLPGLILWGFLLWNSEGGDWKAFKFVFFRPKKESKSNAPIESIDTDNRTEPK